MRASLCKFDFSLQFTFRVSGISRLNDDDDDDDDHDDDDDDSFAERERVQFRSVI